jgi:tetratricopeptide (TPR) repeat protein
MYDRAFTLTLTGPSTGLAEAESLLQRCWSRHKDVSQAVTARVAALMASVCIKHGKHQEAAQWLEQGEMLLATASLDPVEMARERTNLLYDKGENCYVQGDYPQARTVFEEMLEQSRISDWQRSSAYAQNWLAWTSILQGELDGAEDYARAGWSVVPRIKERRLVAYYHRTFAQLHAKRGETAEALTSAAAALDAFERLGMPPHIREMRDFIAALAHNTPSS